MTVWWVMMLMILTTWTLFVSPGQVASGGLSGHFGMLHCEIFFTVAMIKD